MMTIMKSQKGITITDDDFNSHEKSSCNWLPLEEYSMNDKCMWQHNNQSSKTFFALFLKSLYHPMIVK